MAFIRKTTSIYAVPLNYPATLSAQVQPRIPPECRLRNYSCTGRPLFGTLFYIPKFTAICKPENEQEEENQACSLAFGIVNSSTRIGEKDPTLRLVKQHEDRSIWKKCTIKDQRLFHVAKTGFPH